MAERTPRRPVHQVGDEVSGFRIRSAARLEEIGAVAYHAIHLLTGAEVVSIEREDPENLFSAIFRTPPHDSSGVAHILEHAVLAGSKRYPIRDVFNELSKGTLSTFVNAFTTSDATVYPVCAAVAAEYWNLAAVYLDLVLNPRIERNTFLQEGHHLELDDEGRLFITGIVYNEMKGAFSSPERVAATLTMRAALPDTPYAHVSGGHPDHIPDLTYEDFVAFHRRYYAPSNARIFLYGDIPTAEKLAFIDERLDGYARTEVASSVSEQSPWTEPRTATDVFPAGRDEPLAKRSTVNVSWLTAPSYDADELMVLDILTEALLGNAGAPLRKALIDSGLGGDLSPASGLSASHRQLLFTAGLRGTEPEHAEAIESLCLSTLKALARDGLDPGLVDAALHQVEFYGREISRARYPFPIRLMFRAMNRWLHDHDPISALTFSRDIERLRARWTDDPRLFESAIERYLVDNPHRLRAVTSPDPELAARREARLRDKLDARKAAMTPAELDAVRAEADALRVAQRAKDDPAALARFPRIALSDVPRETSEVPTDERRVDGARVLRHDVFSNGIGYLDLSFDVVDVPERLQPYLPILSSALGGMGAGGEGYEAFSRRKSASAGGVSVALDAWTRVDGTPAERMTLHIRAIERNLEPAADIARRIVSDLDLTDTKRLRELLAQTRNRMKAALAPQGHVFAWQTAGAGLRRSRQRVETWRGAPALRFIERTLDAYESDPTPVISALEELVAHVIRRDRVVVNVTGSDAALAALDAQVAPVVAAIPEGGVVTASSGPTLSPRRVGVPIPGEVCYVAAVAPVPAYTADDAPTLLALATYLRAEILYKRIRVEGNAYGAHAIYEGTPGLFVMVSYRDPHLLRTLETYREAVDDFLAAPPDEAAVRTTVIGTLGRMDRPRDPAAEGYSALRWDATGLTRPLRQRFRDGILTVDGASLCRVGEETLRPALAGAVPAVYAPRERIEAANRELDVPFEIDDV